MTTCQRVPYSPLNVHPVPAAIMLSTQLESPFSSLSAFLIARLRTLGQVHIPPEALLTALALAHLPWVCRPPWLKSLLMLYSGS